MAQEPLNRSWSIFTREVTLPEVAQQISPSRTDVLDDGVWRRYKMGGGEPCKWAPQDHPPLRHLQAMR